MDKSVYQFISKKTNDPIAQRRTCKSSGQPFAIFQKDLDFYNKIWPTIKGQKYPCLPPVLEPKERQKLKLSFRNNRKLYYRKCDLTWKNIVSIYSPDKPYKVYHQDVRYTDQRDPMDYGQNIDQSKTFFEQFGELYSKIPKMALININNENSQYANYISNAKNCYMSSICYYNCENIYYSNWTMSSSDCSDCYHIIDCQRCIGCTDWEKLQSCYYLHSSNNTNFSYFSAFLENCSDCIFCNNLVGQKYHIFNQKHSPEEYQKYLQQYKSDPEFFQKWFTQFQKILSSAAYPAMNIIMSENSIGNNITDNKNTLFCTSLTDAEDCRYSRWEHLKNVRDISGSKMEMWLECINVGLDGTFHLIGCSSILNCNHMYYCDNCYDACEYCFGCTGLRWKKYCILNKQYTQDEREIQVTKIIQELTNQWIRWHFFPRKLSAFAYNETRANEIHPLTKEQALQQGFKRKNEETTTNKEFRITQQEQELHKKMWIIQTKIHPETRYKELYQRRDNEETHIRTCDHCHKKTLSIHPQNSKFKVYCEACYNQKMY